MSFYKASIIAACKCPEADAAEVEDIMRHEIFHSTLDWQSRAVFDRGAREAYKLLLALREAGWTVDKP